MALPIAPRVVIPKKITKSTSRLPDSRRFRQILKKIIEPIMHLKGNDIPVSEMSLTERFPPVRPSLRSGVAPFVPKWIAENCIQCNQCVQSCPHAAIRAKQIEPERLKDAPETFKVLKSISKNDRDLQFKIQVYTEDCQGCGVCIETCPSKVKSLEFSPIQVERDAGEIANAEFFEQLPYDVLDGSPINSIKGFSSSSRFRVQRVRRWRDPVLKMVSQICGDRMIVANAPGCSSIQRNVPDHPVHRSQSDGQALPGGNSLFEDNAEYGLECACRRCEPRAAEIDKTLCNRDVLELKSAIENLDCGRNPARKRTMLKKRSRPPFPARSPRRRAMKSASSLARSMS